MVRGAWCKSILIATDDFLNSFQMNNTVGKTLEYIDGGRPKCRLEECPFGNFITDAMADEMKVGIAVMNSGGIKGSFKKGLKIIFVCGHRPKTLELLALLLLFFSICLISSLKGIYASNDFK